jgi:hypothetical protein
MKHLQYFVWGAAKMSIGPQRGTQCESERGVSKTHDELQETAKSPPSRHTTSIVDDPTWVILICAGVTIGFMERSIG